MNQRHFTQTAANCSPVFSIAGVMPAASGMAGWKTAYPNPDAEICEPRPAGHGPSMSMAGVMPGCAETAWRTAMPNPIDDVLDAHGYAVTRIEAGIRADALHVRQARMLHAGPTARNSALLANGS